MIAVNRVIGIFILATILVASGCTNFTTRPLPVIPGTDTSTVTLLVNKEDGSAILTGQVRKKVDARAIEEHVRREYGYSKIENQITTD